MNETWNDSVEPEDNWPQWYDLHANCMSQGYCLIVNSAGQTTMINFTRSLPSESFKPQHACGLSFCSYWWILIFPHRQFRSLIKCLAMKYWWAFSELLTTNINIFAFALRSTRCCSMMTSIRLSQIDALNFLSSDFHLMLESSWMERGWKVKSSTEELPRKKPRCWQTKADDLNNKQEEFNQLYRSDSHPIRIDSIRCICFYSREFLILPGKLIRLWRNRVIYIAARRIAKWIPMWKISAPENFSWHEVLSWGSPWQSFW